MSASVSASSLAVVSAPPQQAEGKGINIYLLKSSNAENVKSIRKLIKSRRNGTQLDILGNKCGFTHPIEDVI